MFPSHDRQEFEFDERLRGIITDKESEDYVRELVTKAHGLDTFKTKLSEKEQAFTDIEAKYGEAQTGYQKYERGFQRLEELKEKDLSSFAKAWGITDQSILDLARNIIQQDENPALAQQRQTQFNSVVQGWQQQDQQQQYEVQASNESARLHEMEMELAFSKPEVTEFEKAYDQAKGQSGAFRQMVDTSGS